MPLRSLIQLVTCLLVRRNGEEKALSLMDALRKMTTMPAYRLEQRTPMMKKGRITVGSDADITNFDPSRIIDRATIEEPTRHSEGVL